MKKICVFVILLVLAQLTFAAGPVDNNRFSLTLGAGLRNFAEKRFEQVYDKSPLIFSIDFGFKLFSTLEAFVHVDYLKADGKMTFTQEDTTFKIFPIELGVRYLLDIKKSKSQKIYPYLGGGVGYYMIKEDNPAYNADEKRIGFFVEGGLKVFFGKSLFIDAKLKDVILKSENDTNVGGLAYMGGIGFSF